MQAISDEILKAIKYALDRYKAGCDKTYISVIKKINENGTYTILDDAGCERNVKCAIPGMDLAAGKNVWIKVPCGNLNRMHICGMA